MANNEQLHEPHADRKPAAHPEPVSFICFHCGSFEEFLSRLLSEVVDIESYLKVNLEHFFYPHTVEELIGTLITPIKQNLTHLKSDCETQLAMGCRVRGHKRLNI